MKIKIKNIFNNEGTHEIKNEVTNEKKENDNVASKRRRKGAYVNNENEEKKININLKKYFDNLFKNKNKLSRGYYVLLFCMVILGGASVAITFKAYNLFAKEDYELYAKDNIDENQTVSTISNSEDTSSKIEDNSSIENNTTNAAEAKVITNSISNKKTQTTVKPLSFSKPINGEVQKQYSIDKVIYSKTLELWKTHDGIDIAADIGTNVKSIEKGTIEKVYEDSFYGTTIVIDHGQGYKSSYSNLDKNISLKEKQTVNKGQVIGKVSNTAIGEIKDEPHLHFTLFKDNNNVDPTYIFK